MTVDDILAQLTQAQSDEERAALTAEILFARLPSTVSVVARRCVSLPWFDKVHVAGLASDTGNATKIFEQIIELPIVEAVPWGYQFHALTKAGLLTKDTKNLFIASNDSIMRLAEIETPIVQGPKQNPDIRRKEVTLDAILLALDRVELPSDNGVTYGRLRFILITNWKLKKTQKYYSERSELTAAAYVYQVADTFAKWGNLHNQLLLYRDSSAWNTWYAKLCQSALSYLIRKGEGYADWMQDASIELTHHAMLIVLNEKVHFHFHYSFEAWLYRILLDVCGKEAYKRTTQQGQFNTNQLSLDAWNVETIHDSNIQSAEDQYIQQVALPEALKNLSKEDRMLIQLVYYERYTIRDAAAKMGRSISSLYSQHARLKKSLSKILGVDKFNYISDE